MFYKCLQYAVQRPSRLPPQGRLSFCSLCGHGAWASARGESRAGYDSLLPCSREWGGDTGQLAPEAPYRQHTPATGVYVLPRLYCRQPPLRIFFVGLVLKCFMTDEPTVLWGGRGSKLSTGGKSLSCVYEKQGNEPQTILVWPVCLTDCGSPLP